MNFKHSSNILDNQERTGRSEDWGVEITSRGDIFDGFYLRWSCTFVLNSFETHKPAKCIFSNCWSCWITGWYNTFEGKFDPLCACYAQTPAHDNAWCCRLGERGGESVSHLSFREHNQFCSIRLLAMDGCGIVNQWSLSLANFPQILSNASLKKQTLKNNC